MGFSDLINTLSTWKIYQFEQLVSVFVCAARAVYQQPPVIDGVTGAWG